MDPSHSASRPPAERESRELLEDWARRFGPALRRYFTRHAPPAEAEDLVQELFLGLARRSGLTAIDRPESYLFHAASNVLRDRGRKQLTHRAADHEPFEVNRHGEADFSSEHVLIQRAELDTLLAALHTMKERPRAVFVLYHFEGMGHAEIGRRLGMAVSTVEKNMARANAHLLENLGSLE
jgi:RNA polymerase sigma factor (sigma-70 family)